jgi:hypothetical protein
VFLKLRPLAAQKHSVPTQTSFGDVDRTKLRLVGFSFLPEAAARTLLVIPITTLAYCEPGLKFGKIKKGGPMPRVTLWHNLLGLLLLGSLGLGL